MAPTQQELARTQSLLEDLLNEERARSEGDIEISAAELSERLGLRKAAVEAVLDEFGKRPNVPVRAAGNGRWEVSRA